MINKSKLKSINFSDISNTSNNIEEEISVNFNRLKTNAEEITEFILITTYVPIIGFYIVKSRK